MARLPRLALPGHTHVVLQCAHAALAAGRLPLFADEVDRQAYRSALFTAAADEQVSVVAYALCDHEVRLLLSPATAAGLSRLMQSVSRRYVSAHHRRHGGKGTLWDGRYRAAVVEPGAWRLAALQWVDGAEGVAVAGAGLEAGAPAASAATRWGHSSARQRLGDRHDPGLHNPPEWWPLGNTPFEREAAYRALLDQGLPEAQRAALRRAALGGWALGSTAFAEQVALALGRPATPRARGRPRKSGGITPGP